MRRSQSSPNRHLTSDCGWMPLHLSNGRQINTTVITLYTADLTIGALHIPQRLKTSKLSLNR